MKVTYVTYRDERVTCTGLLSHKLNNQTYCYIQGECAFFPPHRSTYPSKRAESQDVVRRNVTSHGSPRPKAALPLPSSVAMEIQEDGDPAATQPASTLPLPTMWTRGPQLQLVATSSWQLRRQRQRLLMRTRWTLKWRGQAGLGLSVHAHGNQQRSRATSCMQRKRHGIFWTRHRSGRLFAVCDNSDSNKCTNASNSTASVGRQ